MYTTVYVGEGLFAWLRVRGKGVYGEEGGWGRGLDPHRQKHNPWAVTPSSLLLSTSPLLSCPLWSIPVITIMSPPQWVGTTWGSYEYKKASTIIGRARGRQAGDPQGWACGVGGRAGVGSVFGSYVIPPKLKQKGGAEGDPSSQPHSPLRGMMSHFSFGGFKILAQCNEALWHTNKPHEDCENSKRKD